MKGIFFSIAAGIFISLQSVFNARLGERLGFWETNTFVHGTGFLLSLLLMLVLGTGSYAGIGQVSKLYLLGGALGVMIVFSVMSGITALGATYCIAVLLVTQLVAATVIDSFGLFGSPTISFSFTKLAGLVIMIAGILIYQIKG